MMVKLSTILQKVSQYETFIHNNKPDYYFISENKSLKEQLPILKNDKGGDSLTFNLGEPGKIYNLLSDTGISLNGKYSLSDNKPVITQTGLFINGYDSVSIVFFDQTGNVEIDGSSLKEDHGAFLADGGLATLNEGTLTITTAKGYTITQQAVDNKFIIVEIKTAVFGLNVEGLTPGGLLGEKLQPEYKPLNPAEINITEYLKQFEVVSLIPPILWKRVLVA